MATCSKVEKTLRRLKDFYDAEPLVAFVIKFSAFLVQHGRDSTIAVVHILAGQLGCPADQTSLFVWA